MEETKELEEVVQEEDFIEAVGDTEEVFEEKEEEVE